jgi:cytidine deaminase
MLPAPTSLSLAGRIRLFWCGRERAGSFPRVNLVSHDDLIASAEAVLNPHTVDGRELGDVASALVTEASAVFCGVCIDTSSGTGFCAEHAAIAAMVTAGEYKITKIVAVWRDTGGVLHVVPPCGRCREFIRQIDPANLDTEVVLGRSSSARLRDLLPHSEWPSQPDSRG